MWDVSRRTSTAPVTTLNAILAQNGLDAALGNQSSAPLEVLSEIDSNRDMEACGGDAVVKPRDGPRLELGLVTCLPGEPPYLSLQTEFVNILINLGLHRAMWAIERDIWKAHSINICSYSLSYKDFNNNIVQTWFWVLLKRLWYKCFWSCRWRSRSQFMWTPQVVWHHAFQEFSISMECEAHHTERWTGRGLEIDTDTWYKVCHTWFMSY